MKLLNPIFYKMRHLIHFRRGKANLIYEDKAGFFSDAVSIREESYRTKYHLDQMYERFSRVDYALNLYHLNLLEFVSTRGFQHYLSNRTNRAVDVGSKNFYYAPALAAFLSTNGDLERLEGIECDAFRILSDFYSRYDYAQAYIQDLSNTAYLPANFLGYKKTCNVITMFLPFIFSRPLLRWGLPMKEFQPIKIMERAYHLLEDPGIWIITNQGQVEQERQHQILSELGIAFWNGGKFESEFFAFDIPHYLTVVTK